MSDILKWLESQTIRETKEKYNFDAKIADERVKHCPECGVCWEFDRYTSKNPHNIEKNRLFYNYYEDFPVYGKKKEICPKCKE